MTEEVDAMDDAVLIRYLHDELGERAREHVDARLAATPALARRLNELKQRSSRLSSLLAAVDPTPGELRASAEAIRNSIRLASGALGSMTVEPSRPASASRDVLTHPSWWWRASPGVRAAALIVLLLGGVLLVEPARAWVFEQARVLAAVAGLAEDEPRAPVLAPGADDAPPVFSGSDMRISVAWSADSFEIFSGTAAGRLIVAAGPAGQASAEIAGTAGTTLLLMPSGIRIEGPGGSEAVFQLTLPPAVRTLYLTGPDGRMEYALPSGRTALELSLP